MIKKYKKVYIVLSMLLLVVISISLIKLIRIKKNIEKNKVNIQDKNISINDVKDSLFEEINNLSSWVVYWDLEVDDEIKQLENKLDSVSYFAVNFNDKKELLVPQKLITYYNDSKIYNFKKYITIVNDIVYDNGRSSVKDKDILKELLTDEVSRSNHIKEIISLANKYKFNGIEIDYEQIKGDIELWNNFLLFIKELYSEARQNNLDLRVILEPNAPIDKLDFIEGPTYVMMCYNLHGGFSEPGEKANKEFIESLIEKMGKINSNKIFAIAPGGFDWVAKGNAKAVSEVEANKIIEKYNVDVKRDNNSQYLYFNYIDEDDIKHEVWYADKVTLEYLSEVITEAGYDISLWRLGSNLFK